MGGFSAHDRSPRHARRTDRRILDALSDGLRDEHISRRQFVERLLGLGVTAAAAGGLLAACGGGQPATRAASPAAGTVEDRTRPDKLYVLDWSTSLPRDTVREFQQRTGITVVETFIDYYGDAVLSTLRAGARGYDAIVVSQHFVDSLRRERLIEPLDMSLLPTFANVSPLFQKPAYDDPDDPGRPALQRAALVGYGRLRGPSPTRSRVRSPAPGARCGSRPSRGRS